MNVILQQLTLENCAPGAPPGSGQIPTLEINSAHSAMHQSGNYSYFLSPHSVTKRQYHMASRLCK